MTAEAKAAFERALALDAQDVKARYFLGLAAEQDGQPRRCRGDLARHGGGRAGGAPWVGFVRGELARLEGGPAGRRIWPPPPI